MQLSSKEEPTANIGVIRSNQVVGAQLANAVAAEECEVSYWLERNVEVDFIARHGKALTARESFRGRRVDVSMPVPRMPEGRIKFGRFAQTRCFGTGSGVQAG